MWHRANRKAYSIIRQTFTSTRIIYSFVHILDLLHIAENGIKLSYLSPHLRAVTTVISLCGAVMIDPARKLVLEVAMRFLKK